MLKVEKFLLTGGGIEALNEFIETVDLIGEGVKFSDDLANAVVTYREKDSTLFDANAFNRANLAQVLKAIAQVEIDIELLEGTEDVDKDAALEAQKAKLAQLQKSKEIYESKLA